MSDESVKIDFGDDALGRTMRTIVMIADGAISTLVGLGWTRKSVNLEIDEKDPLPCWVTLKGKRVFEIGFDTDGPELMIIGRWIEKTWKPSLLDRILGR